MSNDELEEKGLLLVCKNCNSLNIKEEIINYINKDSIDICNNCGTVDYTKIVTEDQYEELNKIENLQK